MRRWAYFSHPLEPDTPAYGGGEGIKITAKSSIEGGDPSNSSHWSFSNHLGTHVDFPRHFTRDGDTAETYPPSFWLFTKVYVSHLDGSDSRLLLGPEDFGTTQIPRDTELLLAKTGFSKFRKTGRYFEENPGFLPETADFLQEACPDIRVFGFDSISLSSWREREKGREAHRAFLGRERPILILEDMDLSPILPDTKIHRVIALPLRVSRADGAPCTVIAEIE